MANNKFVKWAVGLSGVALFTGFVGIIQQNDQSNAAIQASEQATNSDFNSSSPSQNSTQGSVRDEWANSANGYTGGAGSGLQSGSPGFSNTLPSDGRMRGGKVRSHAS